MGSGYQELARRDAEIMLTVSDSSGRWPRCFMEAIASIQFQDVTRQQLETIVQAPDRLDRHAVSLAERLRNCEDPSIRVTPLAEQPEEIFSQYVMPQRSSHRGALNQAQGPAAEGRRWSFSERRRAMGKVRRVAIDRNMTIYEAEPLKEILLNELRGGIREGVELDLSRRGNGHGRVPVAGARQERKPAPGARLSIVARSTPPSWMSSSFYNMLAFFGDPVVIAAEAAR